MKYKGYCYFDSLRGNLLLITSPYSMMIIWEGIYHIAVKKNSKSHFCHRNKISTASPVVSHQQFCMNSAGNYMLKINNRITRTRFKICSKLTMKTPEFLEFLELFWCFSILEMYLKKVTFSGHFFRLVLRLRLNSKLLTKFDLYRLLEILENLREICFLRTTSGK